jgi:hypothetical protein
MDDSVEESQAEAVASVSGTVKTRIDPRTGKQIELRPESFWRDHEERRRSRGQSVSQYCEQEGLALSTFRRWSSRLGRPSRTRRSEPRGGAAVLAQAGFLSVPIRGPSDVEAVGAIAAASIEVQVRSGMTVRLYGPAADRAIDAVMAGLTGSR